MLLFMLVISIQDTLQIHYRNFRILGEAVHILQEVKHHPINCQQAFEISGTLNQAGGSIWSRTSLPQLAISDVIIVATQRTLVQKGQHLIHPSCKTEKGSSA